LGALGFWILELYAIYAMDGLTDKSNAHCPFPMGGSIIISLYGERGAMTVGVNTSSGTAI